MGGSYVDSYSMSSFYNKIYTSNQYVSPESKIRKTISAKDNMTELINESDKFRNRITKLDNYKKSTHQESKLIRNINSFVKEYNSFKKKADGAKDSQISKKMDELEKLISDNKKELKKAGITVDKKNQLRFDSTDFDEINKKVFEGLFSGKDSFIKKANKIIRDVNYYSKENEISEEYVKYHPTVNYSRYEINLAGACNGMNHVVNAFSKRDSNFDELAMSDFSILYNNIILYSPGNSTAIENLKNISSEKQEELSKIGITVDEEGCYGFNPVDDMEAANTAFDILFHDSEEGEATDYVSAIKQSIYDIFRQSLKTDKIGITIDQGV